jgi:hypothetical protein
MVEKMNSYSVENFDPTRVPDNVASKINGTINMMMMHECDKSADHLDHYSIVSHPWKSKTHVSIHPPRLLRSTMENSPFPIMNAHFLLQWSRYIDLWH